METAPFNKDLAAQPIGWPGKPSETDVCAICDGGPGNHCSCSCGLNKPEWTMPTPPPGREWHRRDFEPEDLKGGYRPLMLGEVAKPDDEFKPEAGCEAWRSSWQLLNRDYVCTHESWKHRTRRPVPEAPKAKPVDASLIVAGGFSYAEGGAK